MHSTRHIDYLFGGDLRIEQQKTIYNTYHSLAVYKDGLPRIEWKEGFDYKEYKNNWKENHWKEMIAYDWLIDIDANSHDEIEEALNQSRRLKLFLDKLRVPYRLVFSGMGFHFVIPYDKIQKERSFDPTDPKR